MGDAAGEIVIGREAEAAIRLGPPLVSADGYARLPVRIVGPGIDAAVVSELEAWSGGLASLSAYFDELASSWRGWDGTKDWHDDAGILSMSATHDGKGLIVVRVSARSLAYDWPGAWSLAIDVPIEPGALTRIAEEVKALANE